MKTLNIVVSLPGDNRYLREQATAAATAAERFNMTVQVINAESDPVNQSQQLLELIQAAPERRPDAIVVEPVTESGLPRVAEAAIRAGVGWTISNARVDYVERLRKISGAPIFSISQDHGEIGRIQAKQLSALLPGGGNVLYLRGPASNSLACQRAEGLESSLPDNVRVKTLKIQWTEESAYQSVTSWLRLSTVRADDVQLIASQNIDFVSAARKAFQDHAAVAERSHWLAVPYTGAGVFSQVKPLVEGGTLAAAVVTSLTVETALEMLRRGLDTGVQPPEFTPVSAYSYPALEELARQERRHFASAGAR
jgi:ABC-type sugar transport system substrate-binding protein